MKILKNKTYQGLIDKVEKLTEENKSLKATIKGINETSENRHNELIKKNEKIGELEVKIASSKNKNMQLEDENRQLKEEKKKLLGAKGGYIKEIHKLKKQVEELDFKLKESMTDKYLVRKIPSGRRPKGQPMKLTSHTVVSNITRKMFNND